MKKESDRMQSEKQVETNRSATKIPTDVGKEADQDPDPVKSFTCWLGTLGYSAKTIYNAGRALSYYLEWQEAQQQQVGDQAQIGPIAYLHSIATRSNRRRAGALSPNTLIQYRKMLKCYAQYLNLHQQASFLLPEQSKAEKTISLQAYKTLSIAQVQELYSHTTNDPQGLTDRAILSLCYGLGLRRSEAIGLKLQDIDLEKDMLKVSKGKGGKARYVPMSRGVREELQSYLLHVRNKLSSSSDHLLQTEKGPMRGNQIYDRFKRLYAQCSYYPLSYAVSLHSLRHSIASHLLHKGMAIEEIRHFLGHSSLESTMIYTAVGEEKS